MRSCSLAIFGTIIFLLSVVAVHAEGEESYFYAGTTALASKSEGETHYYVTNVLAHTGAIMNAEEELFSYQQLPFGQTITANNRFAYTGKEQDNSQLHYFQARYYDSTIGRFTSTDPIQHNHAYSFVKNNPLYYIDPDGLDERVIIIYNSRLVYDEKGAELIKNWIDSDIEGKTGVLFN